MLWVLVGVLVIAFLFCVWGFFQSLKQHNKTKNLQKTADFNFKTKNGNYSFIYTIKGFLIENGKEIKVALQPVLGFSDLATSGTNQCRKIIIKLQDNSTKEEIVGEEKILGFRNTLNVNDSIIIPNTMLDGNKTANVHIMIYSFWNLGGEEICEKLEFDYTK